MEKRRITAESVTEGHPDKLCDQISDSILDACLGQDPESRVAVETMVSKGTVLIAGETATQAVIDPVAIAREVIKDIGYTSEEVGMDGNTCLILTNIHSQSGDIALGVERGKSVELPHWIPGKKRCCWKAPENLGSQEIKRHLGAGDQGMMIGYATAETPEYMPMPYMLATQLARRLAQVRKKGILPWLRPDGKSQVTMVYNELGQPERIESIVLSAQHDEGVDAMELKLELMKHVIQPMIDPTLITVDTQFQINPTGRFVIGGPLGDTGVTGRKLMVDTYGSVAHHGGGAFSGKDPTKVDRSGAYMARYIAKNIVAMGLATRCEVSLAYAIGQEEPEMIECDTFGTATQGESALLERLKAECSFAVSDIIEGLNLRRPIYKNTAAYGHFGREAFPWEQVDGFGAVRK